MSKDALVTYHREGHLATITLNRPEKKNAMSLAMWKDLATAVSAANQDDLARVVLVRGAGSTFSAGLDVSPENEVTQLITEAPSAAQKIKFYRVIRQVQDIYSGLESLRQPTVALIQGFCLGAALELVACCDIRLCSEDTTFGLPEARLAIITDLGGLQRLQALVRPGKVREMAFRGHRFGAAEAKDMGLVNQVFGTQEELVRQGQAMAQEIADNPPLAVQGAKEVLRHSQSAPLHQALAYNVARSAMILPSEDMNEAMSALFDKNKKPEYKGR
ncbi:MAG: enoyl-CoA hydratase/isomerase family protein [Deltaproteobacteria bacterium]|nr:enoyl-CoA hydratase/isomerase family protein [Deltaproteobacteria bacterium]